jgi:hypothetical protein
VVKLPTRRHKVAKTLIDNRLSLNLIMRKTFVEMSLNLKDLTPVHTFYRIIPGQSSTPIKRNELELSCGIGDNKRKKVLMFEVASFDIGYNCIPGRPFLLKFMTVIHTAYATLKMAGPKGVITIKADQCDALACGNVTLTHVGRFDEKVAQDQAAKIVKMHDSITSLKSLVPKPSKIDSTRLPSTNRGARGASASNQQPVDQLVDLKKMEGDDKEVIVFPSNPDKKLQINTGLEVK